ncbi:cell death regulator Aven [Dunckerocampus dactyliophorus]|uniref:cell death regulator Aven n=1 Tax=Dunckerocampus dactyliophorus TaxID=161453 RepID=UPI00240519F6|nr:cell death regulator Aven [Dunckerocampus dactyliophorus]XP_054617628.1 cell death regulator Aven [Dunckerocampus dactyliophorus]XP_054617629.1 cell death regulator Aven [Dunckerocampus dactyliophorus]
MEGRPSRGRGGSWKRGGHGGNDSDHFGSERRGRGRGGQHRGRGKKDHHRGRGRGGNTHATAFRHTDQDEEDDFHEEDHRTVFSRRTLESNWGRYEDSEKQEAGDDMPTQRGTDYHVLLASAGDSFTQFRLSEEKGWEKDTVSCSQMSAHFVDLEALAISLKQVPLHQRLNLEAELLQVSTPAELPSMTPKPATFTPPPVAAKVPNTNNNPNIAESLSLSASADSQGPSGAAAAAAAPPEDDVDEELDQLLTLAKPVCDVSGGQSDSTESAAPRQKECDGVTEAVIEEKTEERNDEVSHPVSAPRRQEMTEEDLEDWLDSMIS